MRKINFFLIIFISLLIGQFAFIPQTNTDKLEITNPNTSQIPVTSIRIAIYNEPNVTETSYSAGGAYSNNYTALMGFLQGDGHQVTELTQSDILSHELMTADFDIFIMVDNLPRENIVKQVKEFWLGGGSLLSFDSALPYLMYEGILIPESEGDHGWGTYFSYQAGNSNNISKRHPITKNYGVSEKFTSAGTFMCHIYWDLLLGTSAGTDTINLANRDTVYNYATAVARDPLGKGGRVVHLPGLGMISETVQWLCPKPKGRILFDLSHIPNYGLDPWDAPYTWENSDYYGTLRDSLVDRKYTIDKLYPSVSGNLTRNNLDPYDLLIICLPNVNFTASEVSNVKNWINQGGNFLAMSDRLTLAGTKNLNYLISYLDLSVTSGTGLNSISILNQHPTTEGCTLLTGAATGIINHTGDASSIWGSSPTDSIIGYQEYGNGRVILCADVNIFDNVRISLTNNLQYAINGVNWLTANEAKVLLFVDEPDSPNYYLTPVSNALNELGIDFYLTFDADYTNLSLNLYDWKLLIIDNPWVPGFSTSLLTEVNDFVKGGGRLIMSTFRVNNDPTHPLWARLGFAYDQAQPGGSSLYIWDPTHAIYNIPINYGASRFDPIRDYGDEGDLLTVFPNATALGGYTVSESADNANIVLANGGKTIFNGYLIDQFTGDLDDSTYADNFELWVNEISFMWAQIKAEGSGGIPGYDFYIVISSVFVCMGLISLAILKKRKNLNF